MKSKSTAIILAIFLGGLGIHEFYLGKTFMGLMYLLFCWTGLPVLFAFIDAILIAMTPEAVFFDKYNRPIIEREARVRREVERAI